MHRVLVTVGLAIAVLCAAAQPLSAHFSEGTKLRTILVAPENGRLVAFVRAPAPLFFSDIVRNARASAAPLATPFLFLERTPGQMRYRISLKALETRSAAWRARLESGLAWSQNGRPVTARLIAQRIVGRTPRGGFSTPEEARASLAESGARLDPVFGAAVIEAAFVLEAPVPKATLTVASALPTLPLPPGVSIDNHLIDARTAPPISIMQQGQLGDGATIDGSVVRAAAAFTWQGVKHILEGLDHVALVVCLALGAGASVRLLWLVTAFTLGHSVTLVGTFLGFAPDWPWFTGAVEAAIAASVLYAAAAAFRQTVVTPWVIAGIGLLHGFGFSFVLGEILGRDAPNLVVALAAFNIGIEIGQVAILGITLLAVGAVRKASQQAVRTARAAALAAIGVIAAYWTVERAMAFV